MAKAVVYDNKDGLRQRFGVRSTENGIAGTSVPSNGKKVVELIFRGEDLADVAAAVDVRSVYIPSGATVLSAKLLVTELFVGASGTLDIGTQTLAGVLVDDDGFVAGAAVATLTAGAVITGAGAQIGTQLAQAMRIEVSWDTTQFTAGNAKLIVEYIDPPVQTA